MLTRKGDFLKLGKNLYNLDEFNFHKHLSILEKIWMQKVTPEIDLSLYENYI